MWPGRKRSMDHLNDYWNARIRRAPAEELATLSGEIEPATAAAIDGVHGLHRRLTPDPEFVARLEQQIMNTVTARMTSETVLLPAARPASTNGRTSPRASNGWLPALPAARTHRRLGLISVAAALLLLLAGIGSYYAWDSFSGNEKAPAVIPAVQDSPTPGADWPMYLGGVDRAGVGSGNAVTTMPGEVWRVSLDGSAYRTPAVVGDTAFVGTSQGVLYALDAETGAEKWTFTGDGSLEMTPAYQDGVVYVPSLLGTLYAIDAASGEELWRFAKPLAEYASPTFGDGLLFVGSESAGQIYGVDPATGEEIWSFQSDGGITRTQSITDGVVVSGSLGGIVYALDAANGTELWRYDANTESVGTVPVSAGLAFFAGQGGALIVVDVSTGNEIARIDSGSPDGITPPAVHDGIAYVGGWNGSVVAIDVETESILWTSARSSAMRAAPVLVDGVLYAIGSDNILTALDSSNGAELWTYPLDGGVSIGPSVANDLIYVSTDTGSVVALGEITGGEAAAATPGEGTPDDAVAISDQAGVQMLWDTAAEDVPVGKPHGLAIAPNGNVYVGDVATNTIHVLSPDGSLLETWGEPGSGPGQFSGPEDIGFDADGNIYVFDIGNSRVQKFSPDHSFLLEWGTSGTGNGEFIEPHGFVDARHGLVYVVEFLGSRLQVFDLDGNFVDKWGGPGAENGQFRQPATVSVDAEGNVYVAETNNGSNSRLQQFDSLGAWRATLGGTSESHPASFTEIWGIAFDAAGNMYVADYLSNSIQIFGPDLEQIGVITDIPGAGPLNHPLRMEFGADGSLYMVDWDNQRVLKVSVPLPDEAA